MLAAGDVGHKDGEQAISQLCQSYWYPLYAYVRRQVADVHEAQDLTQAFFAYLLDKNVFAQANRQRGRFRSFLLTAFKHFLSKHRDQANAQKRGGGRPVMSLDFAIAETQYLVEPCTTLTPEQLYDRQWAITLLEQIMLRLENEYALRGKSEHFRQLKDFAIGDHAGITYAEVAARLNTTEAAAKMAAHRLRQRYRELLREEIAQTVATPEEIDDELRNLLAVLSLKK